MEVDGIRWKYEIVMEVGRKEMAPKKPPQVWLGETRNCYFSTVELASLYVIFKIGVSYYSEYKII